MRVFLPHMLLFLLLMSFTGITCGYSFSNGNEEKDSKTNEFPINLDSLDLEYDQVNKRFQKLIQKLDKDYIKHPTSKELLRLVFYRTQQLMLSEYKQYSSFNDLIQNGSYDCVSGSTLFALILDRYDFNYQIIETSYHVFITVDINDSMIVLESTEPTNGFITDKNEIDAFMGKFAPSPSEIVQQKIAQKSGVNPSPLLNPVIYNAISLEELIGLQFFNKAVFFYNQQNFFEAYNHIIMAKKYYPSERLLTFSKILEQTVTSASNR